MCGGAGGGKGTSLFPPRVMVKNWNSLAQLRPG